MEIINTELSRIKPYEYNPRNNDEAVEYVANSIKEFGFKNPIILDSDGVIIAGHTRYRAAQKLGLEKVPCVYADDLTEEQAAAFRLADNKTAEFAKWDLELLEQELYELKDFDMSSFGFEELMDSMDANEWFDREKRDDREKEEGNDEYNEFLDKFEAKKTTDDCYTPDIIYEAIKNWVVDKFNLKGKKIIRPFYPNGDYQKENYPKNSVVIDNPPFSIISEIISFYCENGVDFFLFAPALTLFSNSQSKHCTAVPCGVTVTYENGAKVATSFLSNLYSKDIAVQTEPELYKKVDESSKQYAKGMSKELPKYQYPHEFLTSARANYLTKYGQSLTIKKDECKRLSALDAQEEIGKGAFGGGYLLSERAAAERAAAEVFELSEREKDIVRSLGKK